MRDLNSEEDWKRKALSSKFSLSLSLNSEEDWKGRLKERIKKIVDLNSEEDWKLGKYLPLNCVNIS